MDPRDEVKALLKDHRGFRLEPFRHILEEFLAHAGSLDGLAGSRILELGPGRRADLLRYLEEKAGAARVMGIGRAFLPPWTRNRGFIRSHVEDGLLPDRLRPMESASFDVIYSRRVMERHSIDPWVLLFSRTYWQAVLKDELRNPGEAFPSSAENIHAVFREAFRLLVPGGVIVSEIAKRKYSGLDRAFLESLRPRRITERTLGRFSCIVTVVK